MLTYRKNFVCLKKKRKKIKVKIKNLINFDGGSFSPNPGPLPVTSYVANGEPSHYVTVGIDFYICYENKVTIASEKTQIVSICFPVQYKCLPKMKYFY